MRIRAKIYWLAALFATTGVLSSCTSNDDANEENIVSSNYIVVPSAISMTANTKMSTIDVTSNCTWHVSIEQSSFSDLNVSPITGTGNVKLVVETSANNTEGDRMAIIQISSEDQQLSRSCTVTQSAGDFQAELSLEEIAEGKKLEKIDVEYDSITRDVTIICNTSWLVEKPDVDWCSVINGEGVNNGKFSVVILENSSKEARSTSVRVVTQNRSGQQIPLSIPINQKGAPSPSASVSASLADDGVTITINGTAYSGTKYNLTDYGYEIVSKHDSIHTSMLSGGSVREKSFTATVKEEDGYVYTIRAFATTIVGTEYSKPFELPLPGKEPNNGDNTSPELSRKK